mmetsp:Transcript_11158/g.25562  ORF Transcript_11158/g.25562 Transcript_11158/m.25562 type:complete len:113 (-) Transcript_11158:112-450(-)
MPPPWGIRVECGLADANGLYLRETEKTYTREGENGYCVWYVSEMKTWFIGNPKITKKATYYARDEAEAPPQTGWGKADDGKGVEPLPTITHVLKPSPGLFSAWLEVMGCTVL